MRGLPRRKYYGHQKEVDVKIGRKWLFTPAADVCHGVEALKIECYVAKEVLKANAVVVGEGDIRNAVL